MPHKFPCLLELPPNRVRRNYRGGHVLDALEGKAVPADGDRPENWLCSLTEAVNPGMETAPDEGLSRVTVNGQEHALRELMAEAPEHYLGANHYEKHGLQTGFLAKLLDSSMRLHLQAHPTREFARRELGKPWGKFECYVILSVRAGIEPYIYLGFQHPPTPEEWLRIVTEQDLGAMMACFEKVPVRVGETWFVPGGLPHALGEGLTVLEVMEPSDLVVRCEFEREGVVVPPGARFMGRSPVDALRIFDYTAWPLAAVQAHFRVAPEALAANEGLQEQRRIGPKQIDCFDVREIEVDSAAATRSTM
jgi:mannose-6-phosphate isomerase